MTEIKSVCVADHLTRSSSERPVLVAENSLRSRQTLSRDRQCQHGNRNMQKRVTRDPARYECHQASFLESPVFVFPVTSVRCYTRHDSYFQPPGFACPVHRIRVSSHTDSCFQSPLFVFPVLSVRCFSRQYSFSQYTGFVFQNS